MIKISEGGHAKNVANFNMLVSYAERYGAKYNPTQLALQLPQLYTVSIIAQDKLTSVTIQNTSYRNTVNARREAFCGLQELSAGVTDAFEKCGAPSQKVEIVKDFNRKIHGIGIVADLSSKSKIKLTYDQAVQLFEGLIGVVQSEPHYTPDDHALSLQTLQSMLEWLTQQNKAKHLAFTALKNIQKERNIVLYHPETGLLAIANGIKKHVFEVFGEKSPQFRQVSKIRFKKPHV